MIYQKLSAIQAELFVPKGQRNDFGKYNYRSCEDILHAVKPICADKGCVLIMSNNLVNIGDRNYVEAVATLVELETGEQIRSIAHAREEAEKKGMDGSQITGAASSYARKYALAGLFCIDNEKDSDATNTHEKDMATKEQLACVKALVKEPEKMLKHYKIKKIEELTAYQAAEIIRKLKED